MLLGAVLPSLRGLRTKGKSYKRTLKCGARGVKKFQDEWRWPSSGQYLFPNQWGTGPKTKDAVCHAISKARKSFKPPKNQAAMLEPHRIRSHSGRHRMINDMKTSAVATDAAMTYARIKHKKTFDKYGKLDQEQSGKLLNQNRVLKKTLKKMYS